MPSVPNATKSSPEPGKLQSHLASVHQVKRHGLFDRSVRRCQRWYHLRLIPQSEEEAYRPLP
jgi:hypothetical protein